MKFEPTEKSLRFAAEVEEINEFVSQFEIEGANHAGFRRIFNQGDTEGFDWNKGGRLHSVGGRRVLPGASHEDDRSANQAQW